MIELLVVISIIGLLIAILLPALGSAREGARMAQCGSNQKQWVTVGTAHAVDYKGYFPRAYAYRFTWLSGQLEGQQQHWLTTLNDDDASQIEWRRAGTTFKEYKNFGMGLEMLTCPSTDLFLPEEIPNRVRFSSYSIMGGLEATAKVAFRRWSSVAPVDTLDDDDASNRVFVSDSMYIGGGVNSVRTNHLDEQSKTGIAAQLLGFGDGHVVTFGPRYYGRDADPEVDVSYSSPSTGFFFWEGAPKTES